MAVEDDGIDKLYKCTINPVIDPNPVSKSQTTLIRNNIENY
jgi:hypothetical protein